MAFRARWTGGRCVTCGRTINKGDEITWARKGEKKLKHISCAAGSKSESNGSNAQSEETKQEAQEETETREQAESNGDARESCSECGGIGMHSLDCVQEAHELGLKETAAAEESILDGLTKVLISKIEKKLNLKADLSQVQKYVDNKLNDAAGIIEAKLLEKKAVTITIENKDTGETKDCGVQHESFPLLLKMMSARDHNGHKLNIWLTGPAGTGKTSAAEIAASALGLEFASTGALTESYKIFGFIVPGTGEYAPTPFRKIWAYGGVFLFDDCDGSDPNVLIELNNALANGGCTFPDGYVKRHPDCVIILTANTWGLGATNDYVGRFKQDAAFLDRFVKISWPIDEKLETATAPNEQWTKRVQEVRAKVKDKGIKVLVTPRASYYGAALLASGLTWVEAETATLKGAMTSDQWESVK